MARPATERHRALARAERADLVATLEGLTDEQWHHASACPGWTVRDVVTHLVAWDRMLLHRSTVGHAAALAKWLRRPRPVREDDVLDAFRDQAAGRWLFDGVAAGAQLAEYVVHHDDIRRPLGLAPHAIPPERLRLAFDGITRLPAVGAKRRLAGHRWVATDLDWAAGTGPTTRELPAETILLTLAGRLLPQSSS